MHITPRHNRRNVFLDIETIPLDPADEKGALSAATGRIVCICLLIDDGHDIVEQTFIDTDEEYLLSSFWSMLRPTDVFIGFNILGFDWPFVRQRSWILGVRPSRRVDLRRYYSNDLIDLMQLWTNWGGTKPISLEKLGNVLGIGGKSGHGSEVADWWNSGKLDRIGAYCQDDVRLTYRAFCRMMFAPVSDRYLSATSLKESISQSFPPTHLARVIVFPSRPR